MIKFYFCRTHSYQNICIYICLYNLYYYLLYYYYNKLYVNPSFFSINIYLYIYLYISIYPSICLHVCVLFYWLAILLIFRLHNTNNTYNSIYDWNINIMYMLCLNISLLSAPISFIFLEKPAQLVFRESFKGINYRRSDPRTSKDQYFSRGNFIQV